MGQRKGHFIHRMERWALNANREKSAIPTGIRQALWVQINVDGFNARPTYAFNPRYLSFTSEM